jgi:hypothetical protein
LGRRWSKLNSRFMAPLFPEHSEIDICGWFKCYWSDWWRKRWITETIEGRWT